jgi:trans-aconitate methyltransferase
VPAALLWPKGRQNLRFHILTENLPLEGSVKVLDFGCGFGDLLSFLERARPKLDLYYVGVDLMPEFIKEARRRHPHGQFFESQYFAPEEFQFDYVFASGTFNLKYFDDEQRNQEYVFSMLQMLFELSAVEMSVDFMRSNVDYKQQHAHHQNSAELFSFIEEKLSRYHASDFSYLPYEFCCKVFRSPDKP